ncbi:geranylgeranyl pyrophosphate synthetase [Aspergillus heteromorphus CBS 117.55]|uniref:Geranylgeranyl pyrophosphate synthetase n=1 Tax=Aspergillus heteromorphus CBS 117.55 TaxID=1448321 RepID=A0A317WP60_9EURO|nr:geranylgeranyl pyrophosphate synthetase [Aspergillus heteromorphus CBS 117.55]PWY86718.1 geranylgeranyl pyrophosphate synthetase [Aspergillus heteromorphus CBS 117.55]
MATTTTTTAAMDILNESTQPFPLHIQKETPYASSMPSLAPVDYRALPESDQAFGGNGAGEMVVEQEQDLELSPPQNELANTNLPRSTTAPIHAPFQYISSLPSKGVRDQVVAALNVWVGASLDVLPQIVSIVGDIHNISLMLDDVEDASPLRRSRPSTHTVFGIPQTVNSATYQLVDVIARVAEIGGSECQTICTEEMKNMLVGQSLDLHWVQHVSPPSVPEYLQMIDGKTGALFRMISRLMIAQSTHPTKPSDLNNLMMLFGRFFQIRDDYANLVVDQYQESKGFCEDLDEGKWSFILLHALEHATPSNRALLRNLLMQRHATGAAGRGHKQLFLGVLEESGSLAFTADALVSLWGEIEGEICRVERETGTENRLAREMLERLRIQR